MVLLGLLLMLACAALAVDAVVENTSSVDVTAFDQAIEGLSGGGLFVAGAVAGVLFALGLAMFVGGLGRAARRRRERRELARESEQTESLRADKARLERQLAAARDDEAYPGEGTTATTASTSTSGGRHRA